MTPEGRVKEGIKTILKFAKAWFFLPVSNGMGKHGIPDVIACVPITITKEMVGLQVGLFVAIEAKALGKVDQATPSQLNQIAAIRAAGGIAEVVDDPAKVAAIVNTLKAMQ